MSDPSGFIRETWHHAVTERLQVAAGAAAEADPDQLRDGCRRLRDSLPPADSGMERVLLASRLRTFAFSTARTFHVRFHTLLSRGMCADGAAERADRAWTAAEAEHEPGVRLSPWVEAFLDAFAGRHQWPPEVRAAMRLRNHCCEPIDLAALASGVGASRSALVESFGARYGMPPAAYQRKWRLLEVVRLLRETDWCDEAIARAVGYASTASAYALVRKETGRTPREIRQGGACVNPTPPSPMMSIRHRRETSAGLDPSDFRILDNAALTRGRP